MKVELSKTEFKENFYKALAGLVNDDTIGYFSVERDTKTIGLMFGNWNVKLKNDGTWEIF